MTLFPQIHDLYPASEFQVNNYHLSAEDAKLLENLGQRPIRNLRKAHKLDRKIEAIKADILDILASDGWILIKGLDGDPDASVRGLASIVGTLGIPVDEVDAGPTIMDITPEEFFAGKVSSRSTTAFDMHTDLAYVKNPPDLITVLCVLPDPNRGGLSVVSDFWSCIASLSDQTLRTLMTPMFDFQVPPRCRDGKLESVPILTKTTDSMFSIRIRFDTVDCKYKHGTSSLQNLKEVLETNRLEFMLEKGMAYIIDNKRMVHGRTALTSEETRKRRKLKRVYGMRHFP